MSREKNLKNSNLVNGLVNNSEFIWSINHSIPVSTKEVFSTSRFIEFKPKNGLSGFIASVDKPINRLFNGANLTLDLFVNGIRVDSDIIKHFPKLQTSVPVLYLYGQIHYDELNVNLKGNNIVNKKVPITEYANFNQFIKIFEPLLTTIIKDWDNYRVEMGQFGDIYNTKYNIRQRMSLNLAVNSMNEYLPDQKSEKYEEINTWCDELKNEAVDNIQSYSDCFAVENILRKFIDKMQVELNIESKDGANGWRTKHNKKLKKAKLENLKIRTSDNDLFFLGIDKLVSNIEQEKFSVSNGMLNKIAAEYSPIRDAVAHTAPITRDAKDKLMQVHNETKKHIRKLIQFYAGLSEEEEIALIKYLDKRECLSEKMYNAIENALRRNSIQIDVFSKGYRKYSEDCKKYGAKLYINQLIAKKAKGHKLDDEEIEILEDYEKFGKLPEDKITPVVII